MQYFGIAAAFIFITGAVHLRVDNRHPVGGKFFSIITRNGYSLLDLI
jgi:hypothetical protein